MSDDLLPKNSTGVASEYLVAGELYRRGYNVTVTAGNTKAIDLLVERAGKMFAVQVKGIQRTKSICWSISLSKIEGFKLFYVLVNLHADDTDNKTPEYFVLTEEEVREHFKPTKSGRDYLDYNVAKKLGFQNKWEKITVE